MNDNSLDILHTQFGFEAFRPGQEQAIRKAGSALLLEPFKRLLPNEID